MRFVCCYEYREADDRRDEKVCSHHSDLIEWCEQSSKGGNSGNVFQNFLMLSCRMKSGGAVICDLMKHSGTDP
jgi:hypothetical protein